MKHFRPSLLDASDDVGIELAMIAACIAMGLAGLAYLAAV